MFFAVLGPVEVTDQQRRFITGGPKQRTVLALLIANAGDVVSTDGLVQGVYGEDAPAGARRSVQTYVSNLRSELGDVIESAASGYRFTAERSTVDALIFGDAVAQATNGTDPDVKATELREALALWRGHPYADVDATVDLTAEIARLNELRARAIEERIDADLELGRHREIVAELDSLTDEYPLRERFRAQQMLALYRSGRQAEALRAYERTRNYLIEEMGLDPSIDLRNLEQRILEQDASLGFEVGPVVRRSSILVADVADPEALSSLDAAEREELIRSQSEALDDAVLNVGGELFAHRGTAVYATFDTVVGALEAAAGTQKCLVGTQQPMRMAIATGEVQRMSDGSIQGPPITRAARLAASCHGGQVLLSVETNQALVDSGEAGWIVRSLGQHDIAESEDTRPVYQLVVDGLPRDFPPLRTDSVPPSLPIEVVGLPGYEVREVVGSGAFGVVHKAYQPSVGREVAVKVIRSDYSNDPEFIRHFEVEAQLVARLEHPHIVPLHDYWRSPEGAFLVMRWLQGGTLQDRIGRGPLSIEEADQLIAEIAPALAFAHRHGVVHRDIRPSNVLLDEDGEAYLSDFGIAVLDANQRPDGVEEDVRALAELLALSFHGASSSERVNNLLADAVAIEPRYPDVGSFVAAWSEAIGAPTTPEHRTTYTPTRNPYKGLLAFGELDAADFYGRAVEVEEIIEALGEHRLVAVVGPSGIGKSSVTRAGVIPAIRAGMIEGSNEWLITDMLPGHYPFEELAASITRIAIDVPMSLEDELRSNDRALVRAVKRYAPKDQTVLLVIDQFEELFTLAAHDERDAFLSLLAATVADERSPVRVVVTMRADFFDHPLRLPQLGTALRAGTVPISAPTDQALVDIVHLPADSVGVGFEPGLVDRIVSDVSGQPGALPLLEYALTELFAGRDSNTLSLEAYNETGGVLGALGRKAESIFVNLGADPQPACEQVFLRLVNVADGSRVTRRRVGLSELELLDLPRSEIEAVVARFGADRLLTFDRDPITRLPTVEVAHEALLSEWPRLRGWIEGRQEDLVMHGRLAASVADWESANRSPAYLLSAGRLEQHEAWTETTDIALTSAEEDLMAMSRTAEDERLFRTSRNRLLIMGGFATAALLAAVLAVAAFVARDDAREQADFAANQARLADEQAERADDQAARADELAERAQSDADAAEASARQARGQALIAASASELDDDPDLALSLAFRGADLLEGNVASVAAVREAIAATSTIYSGDWPEDQPSKWVTGDLSPDGDLVAVSGGIGSYFEVRDIAAGTVLWSHAFPTENPEEFEVTLEFFDDGRRLLAAVLWVPPPDKEFDPPPETVGLYVFDVATGTVVSEIASEARCGASLLGTESTQPFRSTERSDRFAAVTYFSAAYEGCGAWSAPPLSDVALVDLATGSVTTLVTDWSALDGPMSLVVSGNDRIAAYPASSLLDSIGADVVIQDLESGQIVSSFDVNGPSMGLSHDGSLLAVGTGGSLLNIEILDATTGETLIELEGHDGDVNDLLFIDNGTKLVTSGGDALVKIWDVQTGDLVGELRGADAPTTELGISSDDSTIVVFTKGDRWTVASLDPAADLNEGAALETCLGSDTIFNLRGGVRVTDPLTMAYSLCINAPEQDEPEQSVQIVHLWDRATGETLRYDGFNGQAAAIFPDGSRFVAAPVLVDNGEEEFVVGPYTIYDAPSGEEVRPLKGICEIDFGNGRGVTPGCDVIPTFPVESLDAALPIEFSAFDLDVSPGGTFVGGATWSGTGMVWDAATGEALALMQGSSVGFSPAEDRVAFYTSIGAAIHLYDTATFERIAEFEFGANEHAGQFLVFTPDGAAVIGASDPRRGSSDVVIYDGNTLAELRRIEDPHEGGTRDIAVNADGSVIATGGQDGRIRLWDFDTLEMLADLPISTDRIQSVAFADGDSKIITTTLEGPVIEVVLDPGVFLAYSRSRLTRGFTAAECAEFFPTTACPTLTELKGG